MADQTSLYNRNRAQIGVTGDDGQTYYCGPGAYTDIPTTVENTPLPKGISKKSRPADPEQAAPVPEQPAEQPADQQPVEPVVEASVEPQAQ